MGLFSTGCSICGSVEHSTSDCPHSGLASKCANCGSVEHATGDCPHSGFSSKCASCGSTEHPTSNCPHSGFSSKCASCGSVDHSTSDCPHSGFSSKCASCGSKNHSTADCPHGMLGKSTPPPRQETSSPTSSSDESGCATAITWLVGIGIVVFVVVWLAFNVVLPVALLNSALALTVLTFVFKKYKTLFAFLALVGGGYMLLDVTNGWLSVNFVEKVVKNPDWISAFVYINAAAIGFSVWLLIELIWLRTEQMAPTEKRKSVLIKAALILLVAIATGLAPVIYHSIQNPFVQKSIRFYNVSEEVLDIDGNVYHTVTIGTQVWMVENLKTTKYNDGTSIPFVSDGTAWSNLTSPGYCFYNNDAVNKNKYGALYNWYTVNTGKLAPIGWHIPNDTEWPILENYLIANGYNYDGTTTGNKIAKSLAATTDWYSSSNIGSIGNDLTKNNTTSFEALPGGGRHGTGIFNDVGDAGCWWSSTEDGTIHAWFRYLNYNSSSLGEFDRAQSYGFSVRCIRDSE